MEKLRLLFQFQQKSVQGVLAGKECDLISRLNVNNFQAELQQHQQLYHPGDDDEISR